MRRGSYLVVLLLLWLGGPAQAQSGLPGAYEMVFSDTPAWQHHALQIDEVTEQGAKGTVTIDLGLGPQARSPGPDERAHQIPFLGRWDKSGALRFEVQVGTQSPVTYGFALYPMNRDHLFVGTVEIDPKRTDRSGPWRTGVLVRPTGSSPVRP